MLFPWSYWSYWTWLNQRLVFICCYATVCYCCWQLVWPCWDANEEYGETLHVCLIFMGFVWKWSTVWLWLAKDHCFPPHFLVPQLQWFGLQMGVLTAAQTHALPLHIKSALVIHSPLMWASVFYEMFAALYQTVQAQKCHRLVKKEKEKKDSAFLPVLCQVVFICSEIRPSGENRPSVRSQGKERVPG